MAIKMSNLIYTNYIANFNSLIQKEGLVGKVNSKQKLIL